MPNRLATETSPYLLQHAENPVDWYPWGEEAFQRAAAQNKPIFLSVGYSSCHWCHVMAHESFEDERTAQVLNERFVNVKVDREERPDVDAVYMEATQALTGRGGWPMSVFVTPTGEPFYAGTYWPSDRRHGMPSFLEIVDAVWDAWTDRRDEVGSQATRIAEAIAGRGAASPADGLDLAVTDEAVAVLLERAWDRSLGGFGRAPKFPQAMTIEFLLERHARTGEDAPRAAAIQALDAMARGGIYDHVGGGFARYSTDAHWLVPHFEKMLYDNGLLLAAYAKGAALTSDAQLDRVTRETADYLLREMRHPHGGFFSATDADSEGVEGRFFTWSLKELAEVVASVGADPDRYAAYFGASASGNWEGSNILHEPTPRAEFAAAHDLDPQVFRDELARVRGALYERREQRVHPGLDDKILASWNGIAVRGLALAGAHLGEPRYVAAATAAADFVERHLVVDGALHHTWRDGRAAVGAFLEDVALLADAYLTLFEVTGEVRWFRRAEAYAEDAVARFADPVDGGYFQTADDAEQLYTRPKDTWDNATPSGNSALAAAFVRLGALTGDGRWQTRAEEQLRTFGGDAPRMPTGYGYLLRVMEFLRAGPREVAVVGAPGDDRAALVAEVWRRPRPGTVVAVGVPEGEAAATVPLLAERPTRDGRAAAYVCRDFVCDQPVTEPSDLARLLGVVN